MDILAQFAFVPNVGVVAVAVGGRRVGVWIVGLTLCRCLLGTRLDVALVEQARLEAVLASLRARHAEVRRAACPANLVGVLFDDYHPLTATFRTPRFA